MLESYTNETKVLVLHLATLELRLCLLEGLSHDDAVGHTAASIGQSLGTMHNTLLPDDEQEALQRLVAAQLERLLQRGEGRAPREAEPPST